MLMRPVIRWLLSRLGLLALVGALLLVITEGLIRSGVMLPIINYKKDPYLPLLEPNQRAVMYLANCSYRTPPISINSEGNRGPETDWSRKVVFFLGSSETFGSGVADHETYAALIDRYVEDQDQRNTYDCVNMGGVGFGPFHQATYLERFLANHTPYGIVVRVSIGDRNFKQVEISGRPAAMDWLYARLESAPFFMRKLQAQMQALKNIKITFGKDAQPESVYDTATGEAMWANNQEHWQRMLDLAEQHDARILFFVFDPLGATGSRLLTDQLMAMVDGHAQAQVVHLGPELFGLGQVPKQQRERVYNRRWSLRCDPHANAALHRRLSEGLYEQLSLIDFFSAHGGQAATTQEIATRRGGSAPISLAKGANP